MAGAEPDPRGLERRQTERLPICRAALLRPNGWSRFEVRMIDISERGFRAQCDALLKTGSYVQLEIPGIGAVDARMIWRKAGEIGAQFVQPVDLSHCAWTTEIAPPLPEDVARALARRAGAEEPQPEA